MERVESSGERVVGGRKEEEYNGEKKVIQGEKEVEGLSLVFSFPNYVVVPVLTIVMVLIVILSISNGSDFTQLVSIFGIATGVYAIVHMAMRK